MCDRSGTPSADGRLRIYTPTECAKLGGDWYENGECLRPEGGSFSYDCASMNSDPIDIVMRHKATTAVLVAAAAYWWWNRK